MNVEALLFITGLSALVSALTTPIAIRIANKYGLIRPDAHKAEKVYVPLLGGIPLVVGSSIGLIIASLIYPQYAIEITVQLLTTFLAFIVGLVDDVKILSGIKKTILTLISILPVIIAALIFSNKIVLGRPYVPILGRLRLTLIYWVLLPFAIAGPANVANMLDIMNGIMPSTSLLIFSALFSSSTVLGSEVGMVISAAWIGALVGYLPYNMYPARIFNGDAGSLAVGAAIGSLAVLTRQEFIALVALFPHLLNGFLVVKSIGGFKEHREVGERPIIVREGKLYPSRSPSAPLSLTRLLLLFSGELTEKDVVLAYIIVGWVSALLAFVSSLLVV